MLVTLAYYTRYTRIILCRQCCNLHLVYVTTDETFLLSEMKLVVRSLMLRGRNLLVRRAPVSVANCFWYGDGVIGSAHHPSICRNWMSPLLITGVHLSLLCLRVSLLVQRLCVAVSVCLCVRVTIPDGQSLMTMTWRHDDVIDLTSLAGTLFASIFRDSRRSVRGGVCLYSKYSLNTL